MTEGENVIGTFIPAKAELWLPYPTTIFPIVPCFLYLLFKAIIAFLLLKRRKEVRVKETRRDKKGQRREIDRE